MTDDTMDVDEEPLSTAEERLVDLLSNYQHVLESHNDTIPTSLSSNEAELEPEFIRGCRVIELLARAPWGMSTVRSLRESDVTAPDILEMVKVVYSAEIRQTATGDTPRQIGRFEIIRELGRGGLGVVFLARDPVLKRDVALKIPRPEALLTPDLRQRFTREAEAAARLTHPNLVSVFEVGEAGPVCYIATAYCHGPNLSDWLAERRDPVPARMAAEIVAELADGMEYAHSQGAPPGSQTKQCADGIAWKVSRSVRHRHQSSLYTEDH